MSFLTSFLGRLVFWTGSTILFAKACRARNPVLEVNDHSESMSESCSTTNDDSWLLGCISFARRASFVLMILSGIVIYYKPEYRAPLRRGCFLTIDFIADGLKLIAAKINNPLDRLSKNERNRSTSRRTNFLPLHFYRSSQQYKSSDEPEAPDANFDFFKDEDGFRQRQRQRQRRLHGGKQQNPSEEPTCQQVNCEIHHSEPKEKRHRKKVICCSLPMMQFNACERQHPKLPSAPDNGSTKEHLNIKYYEKKLKDEQQLKQRSCFHKSEKNFKQFKQFFNPEINGESKSEVKISHWNENDFEKIMRGSAYMDDTSNSDSEIMVSNKQNVFRPRVGPIRSNLLSKCNEKKEIAKHLESTQHNGIFVNTEIQSQSKDGKPCQKQSVKNLSEFKGCKSSESQFFEEVKQLQDFMSDIYKIFLWIFGGSPIKRKTTYKRSFQEKTLTKTIQARLSHLFS